MFFLTPSPPSIVTLNETSAVASTKNQHFSQYRMSGIQYCDNATTYSFQTV